VKCQCGLFLGPQIFQFKVLVQWDSGSRFAILEGHDDYRTVYDDDND
jgi:hypothetical protein